MKKDDPSIAASTVRDLLVLELLLWFKEEFFSWVDCPVCQVCGAVSQRLGEGAAQLRPTEKELQDGARNVEG